MHSSGGIAIEDLSRCLTCGSAGFAGSRCETCFVDRPPNETYVVQASCSRCNEQLQQQMIFTEAGKGMMVYACLSCRWVFMSPRAWARVFADPRAVIDIEQAVPMPTVRVEEALPLMPCPVCNNQMDRVRFAAHTPMVIDVCRFAHGVWLDTGELLKVVDYVAAPREMPESRPSGHIARHDVKERVLREEAPRHNYVMAITSRAPTVIGIAIAIIIAVFALASGMHVIGPKGCRHMDDDDNEIEIPVPQQ